MSATDFLMALIEMGHKIDVLWNIFIGVHVAILGALYIGKAGVKVQDMVIGLLLYSLFVFLNANSLIDSYRALEVLRLDLVNTAKPEYEIAKLAAQANFSGRSFVVYVAHIVGTFVVVYALIRSLKRQRRSDLKEDHKKNVSRALLKRRRKNGGDTTK